MRRWIDGACRAAALACALALAAPAWATGQIQLSTSTINEDTGTSFATVLIANANQSDIIVRVSLSATSSARIVGSNLLTISAGQIGGAGSVRIDAVRNDIDTDGDVTIQVRGASDSPGAPQISSRSLTLVDNDTAGYTLSTTTLDLVEGASGVFTVALGSEPTGAVTFSYDTAVLDNARARAQPSAVVFSPAGWRGPLSVTVFAEHDNDHASGSVSMRFNLLSSDSNYVREGIGVSVTVRDDDQPGLVFSASAIDVPEGGAAGYAVRLATDPLASVTIAASSTRPALATAQPRQLVFSSSNWNVWQAVTVSGVDNAAQDADREVPIDHYAVGGYGGAQTAGRVVATVRNDDKPAIVFGGGHVEPSTGIYTAGIVEGAGDGVLYTVRLGAAPASNVTVTATSTHGIVAGNGAVRMTFTAQNWSQAQSVRGRVERDSQSAALRFDAMRHSVGSNAEGYRNLTAPNVRVVIADDRSNDGDATTRRLHFPAGRDGRIAEGGFLVRYVGVEAIAPEGGGSIQIETTWDDGGDADLSVFPRTLFFDASNWYVTRALTLAAAEDPDDVDGDGVLRLESSNSSDHNWRVINEILKTGEIDNDRSDTRLAVGHVEPTSFTLSLVGRAGVWYYRDLGGVCRPANGLVAFDDVPPGSAYTLHAYADAGCSAVLASAQVATPGLALSPSALILAEGARSTYTIALRTAATEDVEVSLAVPDDYANEVTIAPTTLYFSTDNWSIAQTVSVSAVSDRVDEPAVSTTSIRHTVRNYGDVDDRPAQQVALRLLDDDTAGVRVLADSPLVVPEGGSVQYSMVLDSAPTRRVCITPTPSGDSSISIDFGTRQACFDSNGWNNPSPVVVAGLEDEDDIAGTSTITHVVETDDPSYSGIAVASVAAIESDNDWPHPRLAVVGADDDGNMNEGASVTITAQAGDVEAPSDMVVAVSAMPIGSSTAADFRLSDNTRLTIPAGWATSTGVVTLLAVQEQVVDALHSVRISGVATGGGAPGIIQPQSVEVGIVNDDVAALVLSTTTLFVDENGGEDSFTVHLATRLAEDDVAVVSYLRNLSGGATPSHSHSAALTFTAQTWNVPQTVTVTGLNDDTDNTGDKRVDTLSVVGTSAYEGVRTDATVTVVDDDTLGIAISTTTLRIAEGGSGTFGVRLTARQDSMDSILISAVNAPPLTGALGGYLNIPLTFAPATWNVLRTITVNATDDSEVLDDRTQRVQVIAGDNSLPVVEMAVTVTENDAAGIVLESESPAPKILRNPSSANEQLTYWVGEGQSNSYSVRLATKPASDVVVANGMFAGNQSRFTLTPNALTFTRDNWSAGQTVRAGNTSINRNQNDEQVWISHIASSTDSNYRSLRETLHLFAYRSRSNTVGTSTATLSSGRVNLVPEGRERVFYVALDNWRGVPRYDINATLALDPSSDPDLSLNFSRISFSADDWHVPRAVTIAAAEDADAVDGSGSLLLSSAASGTAVHAREFFSIGEIDNDLPGARMIFNTIGGMSAVYMSRVGDTSPEFFVVDANGGCRLHSTAVTRPINNALSSRSIGIPSLELHEDYEITIYSDRNCSSVLETARFKTPGLTLSSTSSDIKEGGTAAYNIVLNTQPLRSVTVTPASADALVSVSGPLTFATTTWNVAQMVTLSAADDAVDSGDIAGTSTITHAVAGYDDVDAVPPEDAPSVAVTVADDDTAGVSVAPLKLSVPEDSADRYGYSIVLDSEPVAAVTIGAMRAGDPDISLAPSVFTFTDSTWSLARIVLVRAAKDADAVDGMARILHAASSSDAKYHDISIADVSVTEYDDSLRATLSATATNISERGGAYTLTARLSGTSTAPVRIAVAARAIAPAAADSFRLSDNRILTVPAGARESTGVVTIHAIDDFIDDADSKRIAVTGAATTTDPLGIVQPTNEVIVSFADDDVAGVQIDPAAISLSESSTAVYAMSLTSRPLTSVTVTPMPSPAVVAVSGSLTFAPDAWNLRQTVTATGIDDDVDQDGARAASIAHGVAGYGAVAAASVSVELLDDDVAGLAFSPQRRSVPVGGTSTYAVSLTSRPASAVTVAVSVSGSTSTQRIRIAGSRALTIAASRWNVPVTVTLADAPAVDSHEAVLFRHAASSASFGYANASGTVVAAHAPLFDAEIADRSYRQNAPIDALSLPPALGGLGTVSYALAPPLPAGLDFDADALRITGTPTTPRQATRHTLTATDEGGLSDALTFSIAVRAVSGGGGGGIDVLRFGSGATVPPQSYAVGRAIEPLTLPIALGGSAPIRYSLLNIPPGLAFDAATRVLSGTPTQARAALRYVYRATDATGAIASLRFSIAIADNRAPSFGAASLPVQTLTVGTPAMLALPAAEGGDGALSYALTPALPAGLAFDAAARTIAGTPTAPLRPTDFILEATDESGDTAQLAFVLEVLDAGMDDDDAASQSFLRGWRKSLPDLLDGMKQDDARDRENAENE